MGVCLSGADCCHCVAEAEVFTDVERLDVNRRCEGFFAFPLLKAELKAALLLCDSSSQAPLDPGDPVAERALPEYGPRLKRSVPVRASTMLNHKSYTLNPKTP